MACAGWHEVTAKEEAMATILFSSAAGIYRGNLHGHSTHSDGLNSSADVVRLYRAAG